MSIEDLGPVASACGLQLDAHLAVEDRSWWPLIAVQRELPPIERVRWLTPAGAADVGDALLQELIRHDVAFVLIGGAAIQSHGRRFDTQDVDVTPNVDQANSSGSQQL